MKTLFLLFLIAAGDSLIKTDDNSTEVLYYGDWSATTDPSFFENSQHATDIPHANCYFTFNQSIVRWIGSKGSDHGYADVYIDGDFQQTIDTYSDKEVTNQLLFEKKGLANDRTHTINIVVKKEKRSESVGYYQDIDYFESIEPVDYRKQYKEAAASELKEIKNGTRSDLVSEKWKPVAYKANAPESGVNLMAGLFNDCFVRNIAYLNHCFASPTYCDGLGWSAWLPGSNEGRMLQGAGNTLRWGERSDMRDIVNTITNKMASRQRADGYNNYYPESESYTCLYSPYLIDGKRDLHMQELLNSERKNYDRVFWTRGLLDAGRVGDTVAYNVLRKFYDWFNRSPHLGNMLDGSNSTNGLPGGGLVYLSPIGRNKDLEVTERYFDQDYWIGELKQKNPLCITYYPTTNPHCYELLGLEAFLDEYRATGAKKYLNAVKGGWQIYNDNFKHTGGTTAICEGHTYPPKSYFLRHNRHTGETCGSVFWININSRLLQLFPTEEKYATEIEQAIYNTLMACQDEKGYIRYHNFLDGVKDRARCSNSCCECSSVGVIAKLPEYIYSIADDGIYINLFAASTITWQQENENCTLVMQTDFPKHNGVVIYYKGPASKKLKIHIRIPSWVAHDVEIGVNGKSFGTGQAGTFTEVERIWDNGDILHFDLPMSFNMHKYTGLDQDLEKEKYALTYGPLLMSLVGDSTLNMTAQQLIENLEPVSGEFFRFNQNVDSHFDIIGKPNCKYMPYYQIQGERFTCYPTME